MNPYGEIAKSMNRRTASPVAIGELTQYGGGRLRVTANGLALTEKDIFISAGLARDAAEGKDFLLPGDRVLLVTSDWQRYYLICKVVNP